MRTTLCIMSYRYGHLAAQAIESALYQTEPFDRIMFFDDGVGDCDHLPDIYPEVEFILRPTNMGIVDNFNDALDRVKTERVMFLGADNWLAHNTLEKLYDMATICDIVYYPAWLVKKGTPEHWMPGTPHGSSIYNVELAKSVGGYEASGNKHTEEDSELFKKMIKAGAKVGTVDSHLLLYRWRHRRNFNED